MPTLKPKPKKPGRPRMAKGEAKGRVVVVRLTADDREKAMIAAERQNQSLSQWIRDLVNMSLQP